MSVPGTLLFARYAYPPNELGYCGPQGAAALLRPDAPAEIARRARGFEGAWSYLEFIAASAGIADPLDEAVVEAYWIGNDLLDGVSPPDLVAWLGERFHGQPGGTWRTASERAVPHHSFQVFEVYPWAGLLTAKAGPVAVSVLDRCRIRAGVVLDVHGESATVRSNPLVWDGAELTPGPPRDEVAAWSVGGRSLLGRLAPGDRVALHWDWVCDVITGPQQERIESLETRTLTARPPPGAGEDRAGG
jgi:hypothetical protein